MEHKLHNLIQGSPEWHQFRLEHDGASEAAAMLGLSKNTTRSELLRMKHTGIAKEFSDFVQSRILDHGHEVEALARPLVEGIIHDELYPATYSYGKLSASCDGLTMDGETAFEHKQWSKDLAAAVGREELPEEHQPQCQQVMMATGASRLIFVVSDGTPDNFAFMWVEPDSAMQKRIVAGWKQFREDLATYTPPEVIPAAVAAPTIALPAVSIQVSGAVALTSNLGLFLTELSGYIRNLPEKPATDQEFADCKQAVKTLQEAQNALDAAEANALGQVASFDEMKRAKALCFNLARDTRLALEKLVVAREKAIKEEIVIEGKAKFAEHIAGLNKRLGKPYMPVVPADFAGVIKGKRTITSLHDAVDTELARAKIAASAIADGIDVNLKLLRETATEYAFLFADAGQIVLKAADDFAMLVKSRIDVHKAAEAKREEEQRERIRKEEEAKVEAKVKAEAKIKADEAAQKAAPQGLVEGPQVAAGENPLARATDISQGREYAGVGHKTEAPARANPEVPVVAAPKPSMKLTSLGIRPTDDAMIEVLALHYMVHESKIIEWLLAMNLNAASERMAKEFSA